MTRRLRQWSALIFLLTVAAFGLKPVKAADCQLFMFNCGFYVVYPNFVYNCDSSVICQVVDECLRVACPDGSWSCWEPCSPGGGPCGSGTCEP